MYISQNDDANKKIIKTNLSILISATSQQDIGLNSLKNKNEVYMVDIPHLPANSAKDPLAYTR